MLNSMNKLLDLIYILSILPSLKACFNSNFIATCIFIERLFLMVVDYNSRTNICRPDVTPPSAQWACRVLFVPAKSTVVCEMLFSVTDITNSQAEPHFKATERVRSELLRVSTANWLAFLLKYKVFDKYNSSTTKRGLWTAMFELTRLITVFFYWIKERNKEKKQFR